MRRVRCIPVLVAMLACLVLGVAQAGAAVVYEKTAGFTGAETEDGNFDNSAGIAFHQASETLAVNSWFYGAVPIFDAEGKFIEEITGESITPELEFPKYGPIEIAVDNTGGAFGGYHYFGRDFWENDSVVFVFDEAGAYQSRITGSSTQNGKLAVAGLAVDNNGSLYVSDSFTNRILKYTSSGGPIDDSDLVAEIKPPEVTSPTSIAFDAAGNMYVTNSGSNFVKLSPSGAYLGPAGGDPVSGGGPSAVAINQATSEFLFSYGNEVVVTSPANAVISRFNPPGGVGALALSEALRRVYVIHGGEVDIFDGIDVPLARTDDPTNLHRPGATLHGMVNADGLGDATCEFEYGTDTSYGQIAQCAPAGPFTDSGDVLVSADVTGLPAETEIHYRLAATNANGTNRGADKSFNLRAVPGLLTDAATEIEAYSARLNGSFDPDSEDTTYYFEWGADTSYGHTLPAAPGPTVPGSATGVQHVTQLLTGLDFAHTYVYRIVATNKYGTSYGEDQSFSTLPLAPVVNSQSVAEVHADSAVLRANITPGGGLTKYHFEYGTAPCSANPCDIYPVPDGQLLDEFDTETVSRFVPGLKSGTTYFFRVVAQNPTGTDIGEDRKFTTFPTTGLVEDDCPNAHVRQQTSAALLLDCRAYELVSALSTGGYNVESDLVTGQRPFGGYPDAGDPSKVLYAVHDGGIPGTGNPTNHGPDPYVATRGGTGWTTTYVGVPANEQEGVDPFGSPLLEASADLSTFAFGGPDICAPCFPDGSTNIPLRRDGGPLRQGMAGALNPGPADPDGVVGRMLSTDGSHLVFGSSAKFESDGNSNGDVTVYDRDLDAGTTRVVSKLPNGTTMTGDGLAALDMSDDGSRIVVAQQVSVDSAGNAHWHPYLHVGDSPNTIDLAPGSTSGVLYNGMTEDGTSIFFSTPDQLGDDGDTSIDLYRADVSGSSVDLTRVSTGIDGTGDTDDCDPVATSANPSWNTVDDASDCSAAPIAGGGGIAAETGSIYFLSPELLDGASNGTEDAPNLYLAEPGEEPAYVTTLESALTGELAPPVHRFVREQGIVGNSPKSIAVGANDDLYVFDIATKSVGRFDSAGSALPFSASQPYVSGNRITGDPDGPFGTEHFSNQQGVAVDSSGGPADGYLYVTNGGSAGGVDVFDPTGAYRGKLPDPSTEDCGVAVGDDGAVYVGNATAGIHKYTPVDGNPSNDTSSGSTGGFGLCQVAVDSTGDVYARHFFFERVEKFDASSFGGAESASIVVASDTKAIAVDPTNDDLYALRGKSFLQLDPSSSPVSESALGGIANSLSIAVESDGEVLVGNPAGSSVAVFGQLEAGANPEADNPAVVHAVNDAETHRYADFQVGADGDHAAFVSTLALTGYDTARHAEVFRHAAGGGIDCASCAPTGVQATGDAALASNGLSLSDDGKVFFNSTDELAPRDLNKKKDVYEWSSGRVELISTGTSAYDSSLLGISADGVDAYFFTRDKRVENDANGSLVRIYDARAGGGFPITPSRVPCQASDECHGPGTPVAPPPPIGTFKGTLGNVPPGKTCRKGFKPNKKGKCVKKKPKKQAKKKRGGRR